MRAVVFFRETARDKLIYFSRSVINAGTRLLGLFCVNKKKQRYSFLWQTTMNLLIKNKLRIWTFIFGFVVFALFAAGQARAANIVVSSAADDGSASTLRAAINTANSNGQADTITFSLAAGTVISPTSQLPALTEAGTTINGSNAGAPGIVLSGANAGDPATGLRISAANCTIRGLNIIRFSDSGIRIDGAASGTFVAGNFIGTNAAGTSAVCGTGINCGNFNRGILIVGTTGNTVGGTTAPDRNVISGNFGVGISITTGGSATISGNYIGTDAAGTAMLSNSQEGVRIVDSSGSTIGGTTTGARNIISGNNSHGIVIIQSGNRDVANNLLPAANNQVVGNYIGVDVGGNTRLRNNGSGVLINAAGNTVGGGNAAVRNVLSGNVGNGVSLSSSFASSNSIFGNYIGVGADGTTAVGNRDNGIQVSSLAAGNTIGGTTAGRGNIIANNGDVNSSTSKAGVYVDPTAAARNSIRGNSIHDNMGVGIDLDAVGASPNDANDPDTGANNLQNFPVLSAADSNGNIMGMLNSLPSTVFAIDYYLNSIADAANAQGRAYIGTTNVVTDSSGNATLGFATTQTLATGQNVTATATNLSASSIGDTSEFSATRTVTAASGANAAGIEADVFPRGTGDGAVTSVDTAQIKRFTLSQDQPYQSNEFQRADCFPYESRGDGVINTLDIGQAKRYQLGQDSLQTAGGPTAGTPFARPAADVSTGKTRVKSIKDELQAPRTVYVVNTTTNPGGTVTVTIGVDAAGDESIYGFSINYNSDNSNRLTNPVVNNPSPATRQVSTSLGAGNTNPGQFGVVVDFSGAGNGQIAAGNNQTLITVMFTVPNTAANGAVPITFTDTPTARSVSSDPNDGPIQSLATTFTGGTVTIGSPAATRTVRVINTTTNPGGTVTVTIGVDANGDESIYGFSINYNSDNSNRLTNPVVNNPSPATRQVSTSLGAGNTNPGEFGVVVDFSGAGNGQIGAGTNQVLITVTFTVPVSAMTGTVPITFTDTPTVRSVSSDPNDGPIQSLATTFTNGSVTITAGPTAAAASLSGRATTAQGRGIANVSVTLLDADGVSRTVTTNSFGYFSFADVVSGRTYILSASSKRYSFTPSSLPVNVDEDVSNLSFIGR